MSNKFAQIAVIFFIICSSIQAQQLSPVDMETHGDNRINSLLRLHIAYNEAFPYVSGYRIQIFMESGNQALYDAEEARVKFEEKYQNIPTYITFSEPYYRVRVGDFRTRLEAMRVLEQIKHTYANAWVIKDNISFADLPLYQKTHEYE